MCCSTRIKLLDFFLSLSMHPMVVPEWETAVFALVDDITNSPVFLFYIIIAYVIGSCLKLQHFFVEYVPVSQVKRNSRNH